MIEPVMSTHNPTLSRKLARQQKLDTAFVWTTKLSALLVLLTLGGILVSLIIGALPSI